MADSMIRKLEEIHIGTEHTPEDQDDKTETSIQKQSYATVLKEEDIRIRMEKEIQSFSDIYFISEAEATLLLPHFRRSVSDFHKKWFYDTKSVRESVGLLEKQQLHDHQPSSNDKEFYCQACSKSHPFENYASVSCGHLVCISCWKTMINKVINENPSDEWILFLKCPEESCQASVSRDIIERFASEANKSKYNQYLLRSYIEHIKTIKWCPASGCNYAVDLSPVSGSYDVSCLCSHRFCWNCREEVHSPVDCESAAHWLALAMNLSGNQNPNWVLENTVPCPQCNRRVQLNKDYSLKIKCLPPCRHRFCWHCLGGEGSGCGLYNCNSVGAVLYEEIDQSRRMAESATYRYQNCYEDWKSNEQLMQRAKANLKNLDIDIKNLSNIQLATEPQLKFIKEAGLQIMECRRVLKWSYAYEYYLREDDVEKQALLKHMQGDAENLVKKLHGYVEDNLHTFLDAEGPSKEFIEFSNELTRLTRITRDHYEGLVRELEDDGLTSVVPVFNVSTST